MCERCIGEVCIRVCVRGVCVCVCYCGEVCACLQGTEMNGDEVSVYSGVSRRPTRHRGGAPTFGECVASAVHVEVLPGGGAADELGVDARLEPFA